MNQLVNPVGLRDVAGREIAIANLQVFRRCPDGHRELPQWAEPRGRGARLDVNKHKTAKDPWNPVSGAPRSRCAVPAVQGKDGLQLEAMGELYMKELAVAGAAALGKHAPEAGEGTTRGVNADAGRCRRENDAHAPTRRFGHKKRDACTRCAFIGSAPSPPLARRYHTHTTAHPCAVVVFAFPSALVGSPASSRNIQRSTSSAAARSAASSPSSANAKSAAASANASDAHFPSSASPARSSAMKSIAALAASCSSPPPTRRAPRTPPPGQGRAPIHRAHQRARRAPPPRRSADADDAGTPRGLLFRARSPPGLNLSSLLCSRRRRGATAFAPGGPTTRQRLGRRSLSAATTAPRSAAIFAMTALAHSRKSSVSRAAGSGRCTTPRARGRGHDQGAVRGEAARRPARARAPSGRVAGHHDARPASAAPRGTRPASPHRGAAGLGVGGGARGGRGMAEVSQRGDGRRTTGRGTGGRRERNDPGGSRRGTRRRRGGRTSAPGADARRGGRTSSSTAAASRPDSGFGASSSDIATDSREARVRGAPRAASEEREEARASVRRRPERKPARLPVSIPDLGGGIFDHRRRLADCHLAAPGVGASARLGVVARGHRGATGAARAHDAGPPSASPRARPAVAPASRVALPARSPRGRSNVSDSGPHRTARIAASSPPRAPRASSSARDDAPSEPAAPPSAPPRRGSSRASPPPSRVPSRHPPLSTALASSDASSAAARPLRRPSPLPSRRDPSPRQLAPVSRRRNARGRGQARRAGLSHGGQGPDRRERDPGEGPRRRAGRPPGGRPG